MSDEATKLNEIWEGDLFNRQEEAKLLEAYIESVTGRNFVREDARSYTIAIDAQYGEGKTFFLKRFAKQLALNHPVAFVDAWADDLADEPLTALAATLKKALDPLIKSSPDIEDKWKSVLEKTGKVAKIAGWGLLKRGVGLLITAGAAEGIDHALKSVSHDVEDVIKEDIKHLGNEIVEGASKSFNSVTPSHLMNERIEAFEAGQAAIEAMKASLEALVGSLDKNTKFPPIIIVIDELDRCRPTYAVKLLEEIKHLFDVPGLVFIFGMNGNQLAHSLAGAYGPNFDGSAYLKRFINREYTLPTPDLSPLVESLLLKSEVDSKRLDFPNVREAGNFNVPQPSSAKMISRYMQLYGLKARDAFQVIDILQTCAGLTGQAPLLMVYLLPAILNRFLFGSFSDSQGKPLKQPPVIAAEWDYVVGGLEHSNPPQTSRFWNLACTVENIAKLTQRELRDKVNENDPIAQLIYELRNDPKLQNNTLARPENYGNLLNTVGRFTNPQLEA